MLSVLSFGCFPCVWFIFTDVSEQSICSIFKADDFGSDVGRVAVVYLYRSTVSGCVMWT
jgi:hypothetical protein